MKLPFLPDDPRIIDSTGALSPDDVPGRFLVIGGGIIGLEMATVYHALGAKVTVVEMLDQLIPGADADLVRPLHNRVKERYAGILLETQVTAVKATKSGLRVSFSAGKDQTFDRILRRAHRKIAAALVLGQALRILHPAPAPSAARPAAAPAPRRAATPKTRRLA